MKKFTQKINDYLSVKYSLEWSEKFKGYAFNFDASQPVTQEHVLICVQSILCKYVVSISYGYSSATEKYKAYAIVQDSSGLCKNVMKSGDSIMLATIALCEEIEGYI